ncbi:transposase [Kitasatospora sp. NPDC101235]|uniref:IS110 family transposase n=1 Tax=Kitasatospora sp. NPDC101235 TaxID=3364101 RepID=UPI0038158604
MVGIEARSVLSPTGRSARLPARAAFAASLSAAAFFADSARSSCSAGVIFPDRASAPILRASSMASSPAPACRVAYLPGLTMCRIADLYPGEAKTDARDAFVMADADRAMAHTLRGIELTDETVAELEMIVGFDDDLAGEATRIANRLHGLLTQIHPHMERVLGPRIDHPTVLALLERFGSPATLRKAGRHRLLGIGDASAFPTAAHLASYAGLASATRSFGSSIRGALPFRRGNKQLKRAFFLAAFASLNDLASRAYYDKKIGQGKRHTQALLCLARRRGGVLFAMLRDGTFYEPRSVTTTP